MDKTTLVKVLTQHFIDHPDLSQQEVLDCVAEAYKTARASGMQVYEPIKIRRKTQKEAGYNAEIRPEKTKGLEDESLNDSY